MGSQPPPWTLTFPSDLRQVVLARAFLEAICDVCGLDRATTDAVVLAAHEAINNVIRHAHQDCPDAQLQLQCYFSDHRLEIHLLDEGAPFDLASVPQLNPGEERVGGRGVFLMRKLMDELSCQPRGERGNTLRMVKRFAGATAARNRGPHQNQEHMR
jgi:serine/threonine-protein kinase RsbW